MSDKRLDASVGVAIESTEWTAGEKWVIKWQFGLLGDFYTALFDAISRADETNLRRLQAGFPDEVQGFLAWSRGGLSERLRAAGLLL